MERRKKGQEGSAVARCGVSICFCCVTRNARRRRRSRRSKRRREAEEEGGEEQRSQVLEVRDKERDSEVRKNV